MAFIRQCKPEDFEATAHICRATLPPSLSGSECLRRLAPYVWTHQFTHLSPETCFVLDDGTGHAVGYCIGCPDIAAFSDSYQSYVDNVLRQSSDTATSLPEGFDNSVKAPWSLDNGEINEQALAQSAYSPFWLLQAGNEDLLGEGYKATMHIDLLDEWQSKGWGKKLIDSFVESVKAVKLTQANGTDWEGKVGKGIFIGVAGDNSKVVPFYEKQGFKVKDRKVKTTTITMVRDY